MASKRIFGECIADKRIANITMTSGGNVDKRIAGEYITNKRIAGK